MAGEFVSFLLSFGFVVNCKEAERNQCCFVVTAGWPGLCLTNSRLSLGAKLNLILCLLLSANIEKNGALLFP